MDTQDPSVEEVCAAGRFRNFAHVVDLCAASQAAFVADDVSNIIKESIDAVLQNQQYSEAKVWLSIHYY